MLYAACNLSVPSEIEMISMYLGGHTRGGAQERAGAQLPRGARSAKFILGVMPFFWGEIFSETVLSLPLSFKTQEMPTTIT